jgi:predicted enzyme related to lactoylglutathione lyase
MAVNVKSLAWLGTRTDRFDDLCRFYSEVFGLPKVAEEEGFAAFRLPTGDHIEVFAADVEDHRHFSTGPVVGFEVDDIDAARAEMEALGIELLIPTGEGTTSRWAHFRAPDGNIYELTEKAP